MAHCLQIDSVIKRYGDKSVLTDVFLSLETKDIVAVFGRNGSGKSTLFKILYGIETAENCFIKLNNVPVKALFKKKDLINYSAQECFIPKNETTLNVLRLFYKNTIPETIQNRFKEVLQTKIGDLSGGEQKLLQLYLILNTTAKFIILDEPFNHLSPLMIDEVKALIKTAAQTKGILLCDHSYHDVLGIATKLYILKNGSLKKCAQQTDLQEHGYLL